MTEPKTNVKVKLIGEDGNVFSIIGNVTKVLKSNGHTKLAKEFSAASMLCSSYNEVLHLVRDYVHVE